MMSRAIIFSSLLVTAGALPSAETGFNDASDDRLQGLWRAPGWQAEIIGLGSGTYRVQLGSEQGKGKPPLAIFMATTAPDGGVIMTPAEPGTIPTDHPKQKPAWWPAPKESASWKAAWRDDLLHLSPANGPTITFAPVKMTSPTIGLAPPADAVILLDATSTAESVAASWKTVKGGRPCPWTVVPGGVLQGVPKSGSVISAQVFGNHRLHLEFRLPYEPTHRGQDRSNSGLFLQGRYEIQILDSFGLQAADNECGGIYRNAPPHINGSAPPGTWQTYDLDFTEAVFAEGIQIRPARVQVRHNGHVIHADQAISGPTKSAPLAAGPEPQGICLQDHGHPVQFRNIWVQPITTR